MMSLQKKQLGQKQWLREWPLSEAASDKNENITHHKKITLNERADLVVSFSRQLSIFQVVSILQLLLL